LTRARLGRLEKLAYALGGTTDIFGHWLYVALVPSVFVGFLHLSPALLGLALAAARLADGVADSYFGWRSDNTRTRWGRRRPYLVVGGLLAGAALPGLFAASRAWSQPALFAFVLLTACAYAPILSAYNMAYQSLGSELTSDTDERTRVMSWRGVVQTLAGVATAWAWWFAARPWFSDLDGTIDLARGARWAAGLAGALMVTGALATALVVPEPYYALARAQPRLGLWATTRLTFRCPPFRKLLLALVLFAVPTSLVGPLGWYVLCYHVLSGDQLGAAVYGGLGGTAYSLLGAASVPLAARLAGRFGKGRTLQAALWAGAAFLAASFFLYTPAAPALSALAHGLFGVAASGFFWVLLPSMLADVVDFDELESGQRREGAFTSTLSYVLKVGTTATLLLSGVVIELTGFDVQRTIQAPATMLRLRLLFAVVPAVAALLAAMSLRRYPLTRATMNDLRARLESRRGAL